MQPNLIPFGGLALIALLTPLRAAAFGDLDCMTVGIGQDDTFAPAAIHFSITFDWTAEQVIVTVDGEKAQTLNHYDTYHSDSVSELRYSLADTYGLTLTTTPDGIEAMYGDHIKDLGYAGTCDVRQAA